MPDTDQQMLNTTGANPFTVTKKHQTKLPGICLECYCSLYRSTLNVCPHCLAAAEDLRVLGGYRDWEKWKTLKCGNRSMETEARKRKYGSEKKSRLLMSSALLTNGKAL